MTCADWVLFSVALAEALVVMGFALWCFAQGAT